jgi:hypothetical protein
MKVDDQTKRRAAERLREVHYHAGVTLLAAQGLEYSIKLLLFLLAEQQLVPFSAEDAEKLVDGKRRKNKRTLGQVFSMLRRLVKFDGDSEKRIIRALATRNWFIHEFYTAHSAEALLTSQGRLRVRKELDEMRQEFQGADGLLRPLIRQLLLTFHDTDIEEAEAAALERLASNR